MSKIDLTGMVYGCLTVIGESGRKAGNGDRIWQCQCVCGNKHDVISSNLKNGSTKSCGCAARVSRRTAKRRNRWTAGGANRNWQPGGSIEDLEDLIR